MENTLKTLETDGLSIKLTDEKLCSRPCNYTVACSIAQRFIN